MRKQVRVIAEGKIEEIILDLNKAVIEGPRPYDTEKAVTLTFKAKQNLVIKDYRLTSRDSLKQGQQFFIDHFREVPCLGSFQCLKKNYEIVLSDLHAENGHERMILSDKKSYQSTHRVAGNGVQAIHDPTGIRLLTSKEKS